MQDASDEMFSITQILNEQNSGEQIHVAEKPQQREALSSSMPFGFSESPQDVEEATPMLSILDSLLMSDSTLQLLSDTPSFLSGLASPPTQQLPATSSHSPSSLFTFLQDLQQSHILSPPADPSQPQPTPPSKAKRRTRGLKACDFCIKRKLKCIVEPNTTTCTKCLTRQQPCIFSPKPTQSQRATSTSVSVRHSPFLHISPSIPRLFTPFDDLDSLPSTEIQNTLLRASFRETQALAPILHRASFPSTRPSPFLLLSLQAVASLFSGMRTEGGRMFERARRTVIPMLSGELDVGEETLFEVLQAVVYLITYAIMEGKTETQMLIGRWMGLAVACARQMGLNKEIPGIEMACGRK